jgi:hypothetical protein
MDVDALLARRDELVAEINRGAGSFTVSADPGLFTVDSLRKEIAELEAFLTREPADWTTGNVEDGEPDVEWDPNA